MNETASVGNRLLFLVDDRLMVDSKFMSHS